MKPESGSDYSDSDTQEDSSEDSDDEILSHRISAASSKQDDKNSLLALGFKSDRSFVSRGHSIGVFKNTSDNKLAFHTTIKGVSNLKGQTFTPEKMMLHEQDSSLILMNPLQKDRLFKMDLELGKVIEEWKISDSDASVTSIVPDSKYAQMTGNKTLIGLNKNSIFRIDPRLPGCKRVEEETKQYVSKNEFNCGATTGKGELAVASGKGEIRLFNKLDKRAKTLLPGFGDPILGIDVSESGKFILATCKSYLLFIDASLDQQDATGFSKAMGAANKPIPKRLQLSSEHVAYMGGKSTLAFTEAHFSTGPSEEKAIIAATGPYVITWRLKDVLKGNLFDYAIKKYSDNVVADNFK